MHHGMNPRTSDAKRKCYAHVMAILRLHFHRAVFEVVLESCVISFQRAYLLQYTTPTPVQHSCSTKSPADLKPQICW